MKKVLVVDDDEEILETIQLILEIGGYEVEALNKAEEVYTVIDDFEPDLIILDIVLGKFDGREICQKIKRNPNSRQTPILMMSGLYTAEEVNGMDHGPNDFLPKPFKMDNLLAKIDHLVNIKKLSRFDVN